MMNLALLAAAAEEAGGGGLMSLRVNLMFWTLVIFAFLYFILNKWVFPAVLGMVEAREKALAEAIEGAKRDREEAARLLSEHREQIEGARADAQKLIAEARGVSEKMRADMLEKTREEQQELLERARRDIAVERDKAIAELRREAVDIAIRGASKVIEENLDSDKNRKLVEQFLASLSSEERQPKTGSR
jgi:F-type H+-transporting ATPase subunit b